MKHSDESALIQLTASYCSVCERCIYDVRKKLVAAGAAPEVAQRIIERLQKEDFINESRFCRSFAKDKFRFNGWGRIRIRYELQRKNMDGERISAALKDIDEKDYLTALSDLLKNKKRTVKGHSEQDIFNKLYRFAAGRGFESRLIIQVLKPLFKENDASDDME